jgi:microcystin-dependent protein
MSTPQYYQTNYNFSGETTSIAPPKSDLGNSLVPVGTILLYGGTTLPGNYLWCDGSQVLTSVYPALYSVIGTTYNITTPLAGYFYLPNLSSNIPIGAANTSTMTITYQGSPLKSGGSKTINNNQLPAHAHGSTVNGFYNLSSNSSDTRVATSTSSTLYMSVSSATLNNSTSNADFLPPFVVVNYIIKCQ